MAGLIIFSQVVLSAQLSFAIVPLLQFTNDKTKMGPFANGWLTKWTGWGVAALIAGLNCYLIVTSL
jgi:manganese transport protein